MKQALAAAAPAAAADPFGDALCLETERLLLRPLTPSDAEAMFAYAHDSEVTRFLPWRPAPDADSVRPFLREQQEKRRRGESLGLAIILRDTGEMIGSTDLMGLRNIVLVRRQAELGYLLARPFWGQGLMSEAARRTALHGFDALRLTRLIAWADAENTGSRRVLEKIGMRFGGQEMRVVKNEKRVYIRYLGDRNSLT